MRRGRCYAPPRAHRRGPAPRVRCGGVRAVSSVDMDKPGRGGGGSPLGFIARGLRDAASRGTGEKSHGLVRNQRKNLIAQHSAIIARRNWLILTNASGPDAGSQAPPRPYQYSNDPITHDGTRPGKRTPYLLIAF